MSMNNDRISRTIVPAGDLVPMLLLSRCQNIAMLFYDNFFKQFFVNENSFRNVFEQDSEKNVTWLALQWRYNGCDGVSNHQPHDCLLNRLFRRKSKKTSKLRVAGLCEGNSHVTGEFHAQKASNTENVSIWWKSCTYSANVVNICWNVSYTDTIMIQSDGWYEISSAH